MKHNANCVNSKKIESARIAKLKLDEIKFLLKTGQITYDDAQKQSQKPLELLNEGMAVIARQHGFKGRKTNFTSFMR